MRHFLPVILCGGAGTRLWPLSREQYPKQFVPLQGEQSLFQATLARLDGLQGGLAPLIVTHEQHRFLVSEQLGASPATLMLEPCARHTAPALTLAALWAQVHQPGALLLVMPSDHNLTQPQALSRLLPRAAELAAAGRIVTFGIVPERPETGYGYLRYADEKLLAFVEKPDAARAAAYLAEGGYLWNSGILALSPETWLEELARHAPDMLAACRSAFAAGAADEGGLGFFRPHADYAGCPADAIDTAVMEKTRRGAVLALEAGWSDVGSWDSWQQLLPRDADGNTLVGDVMVQDAANNLLRSSGRLVAAVGVQNLLVIETPDAVLIADRNSAQAVREVVGSLRRQRRPEAEQHRRVARPWGFYEVIDAGERFQVKRITVRPGQALSRQMHHHRAEHWVVVRGTARVTRGDKVELLGENQSVYIPLGTVHRLENPGAIDLELIEVQSGAYLGEDDIVRYEDRYQRLSPAS